MSYDWTAVARRNGMPNALRTTTMEPTLPKIQLRNVSKSFGRTVANDAVNCEGRAGEIHAILGENGAGKTTLMKILAGLQRPDSGQILIDGRPVVFNKPSDAVRAGIGMVHQHFSLVPALTVAENLALSSATSGLFLGTSRWAAELEEKAQALGFNIRPHVPVWQLSMGERQRVEIFRLILGGATILVLDEPTSIVAPEEAEQLFSYLRQFAASGRTIFFVTHKIAHVKAIADRVTVLRRGKVAGTFAARDVSATQLTEMMLGSEIRSIVRHPTHDLRPNQPLLQVRDLTVKPARSAFGLTDFSCTLRRGEILGVVGISGSGQDELIAALMANAAHQGEIAWSCVRSDIAYIPSDPVNVGVAAPLSLQDNLSLRNFQRPVFSRFGLLDKKALQQKAAQAISDFNIVPPDPEISVGTLSGGNIQKAILGRELAANPAVIVAVTPTAGLDAKTVLFVHEELARRADAGAGVLLVSDDRDEIVALCDTAVVLFEGRSVATFAGEEISVRTIGAAMSGAVVQERQRTLVSA
jgi:simple sugar transport system ATP-binding protein